jgi:hypothetical protein
VDNLFTDVYTHGVRASADAYDGVPYQDLVFELVTWPAVVVKHMAQRSARYGRPQFDVADPKWADDAVRDPFRLVGDGRSRDGETVRVIGWSRHAPGREPGTRGRLLKVWLAGDGHASGGRWIGRTACEANDSEHRDYNDADEPNDGDQRQ